MKRLIVSLFVFISLAVMAHPVLAQQPEPSPNDLPAAPSSSVQLEGSPANAGILDSVNLFNGRLRHTERDFVIKGRGLPLVFQRTYNSFVSPGNVSDGPLGYQWSSSVHQSIFKKPDSFPFYLYWVDGQGDVHTFVRNNDGTFVVPFGEFYKVTESPAEVYHVREKNGTTIHFDTRSTVPYLGYPDERRQYFANSIDERNGNTLTMTYQPSCLTLTTVTDSLGRSLTFEYNIPGKCYLISKVKDWTNREYSFAYETVTVFGQSQTRLKTVTNPLQKITTYTYTVDGFLHLLAQYDLPRPDDNLMVFGYTGGGKLFNARRVINEDTIFTYSVDGSGNKTGTQTNPLGHTRQYVFDDKFGKLTKLINEGGGEILYTYGNANTRSFLLPTVIEDKRGSAAGVPSLTYTMSYNTALGDLTQMTRPSGATVAFSNHDIFGQPRKIKDARGNYTVLKYDPDGNLTDVMVLKTGHGENVDPLTFTPSVNDTVAWTKQTFVPGGNLTTVQRMRDITNLVGPTLEFGYDAQGLNVMTVTRRGDFDGDGTIGATETKVAVLTYDALDRTTKGLRPDWYQPTFDYDALDRIIKGTDDVGSVRDYAYDENSNLKTNSLKDPATQTIIDTNSTLYDAADRPTKDTDNNNAETLYEYTALRELKKITDPDAIFVTIGYDQNRFVLTTTDKANKSVTRTRDFAGRLLTRVDPNNHKTTYEYHDATQDGRLKKQIDPELHAIQWDYDPNGNVIKVTDALGRVSETTYDELNRPTRIVGPRFTDPALGDIRPVTRLTYTALGYRTLVEAGHTNGANPVLPNDVVTVQRTAQYDDFGRLLKDSDALNRIWTFEYDDFGNVTKQRNPKSQEITASYAYGHLPLTLVYPPNSQTITYERNLLGQVKKATTPHIEYTYTYEAAHRLATVTDTRGGASKTLSYTYFPSGRLNSMTNVDETTNYTYDTVGRLKAILANLLPPSLVEFTYDDGGRVLERKTSGPGAAKTTYTYNNDDTLNTVTNRSGPGETLLTQHAYTYDAVGNRLTHAEQICDDSTAYGYEYDALNRLRKVKIGGVDQETYEYDPLGNRTKRITASATDVSLYDVANQLNEIRQGSAGGPVLSSLTYDLNGNLTERNNLTTKLTLGYDALDQTTSATATWAQPETYTYDDLGRRISKTVGTTISNFLYDGLEIVGEYGSWSESAQATYVHGLGLDEPVLRAFGGFSQYYHQDGLGSVVAVTDPDNVKLGAARYDAWGNVVTRTGAINRYGYTGREPDLTGLIYYRSRYYDPTLGRFTQPDPIGFLGGDVNLYAYVWNNPVLFRDPTGYGEMTWISAPAWDQISTGVTIPGIATSADTQLRALQLNNVVGENSVASLSNPLFGSLGIGTILGNLRNTQPITILQTSLDVIGLAPVIGEPADALNALIYAARGDYLNASLSGLAVVPYFGVLATTGKYAERAAQVTGQMHHGISLTIHRALEQHPLLRGLYTARDPRFVTQARDLASHHGYDKFHRNLDAEVAGWIRINPNGTQAQFENYLRGVYQRPDVAVRFPNGL